ncbi:hypothetical protein MCOR02_000432 [Pyricularia oryzae]|nr:hypothetical protein MCOR02_000432 [Pyricularia oryzae]KAI6261483.1 hypothetical protein MCOR19_002292 [Pyricularia oryzae]KAI6325882.1 hypothetical protein MCOR29_003591 [Pyricularia oryzae]KAI6329412.1 hypothetical protein MCOR30_005637 [Pyricularia oryzae]KAI6334338.1 hypothetical protein MCOR28_010074 [Pyricularia oryzae]
MRPGHGNAKYGKKDGLVPLQPPRCLSAYGAPNALWIAMSIEENVFFLRQAVGIPRHEPLAGFSIRGEMVQSLEKKRRQMQSWPTHKEVSQGAGIIIDKYRHHSLASTSSITHVSTEQENQVENKPVFPSQISIMATRQQQWQPGSWYCCQCNGSKTNPPNIPETNTCAMCHANGSHHIKCSDCSAV